MKSWNVIKVFFSKKKKIFIIFKFCIYVYVYSYVHKSTDICGVQKRVSHILELQEVVSYQMWALGAGVRSKARLQVLVTAYLSLKS